MKHPVAVLISDVHYDLGTLKLADAAMRQAIAEANKLHVPLIVAGDLHNTKANLRGECVKAMIETMKTANIPPVILIGNHDLINEKSTENSLEFLKPFASVISEPKKNLLPYITVIPYHHDLDKLRKYLNTVTEWSTAIMHQGLRGSNSGEYFNDLTALTPKDVAGLRIISGHYHHRQHISLPAGGSWDFIGNPYTLNYGEANDPDKGFQVLYSDGSLEFIPTNLRAHKVFEFNADDVSCVGIGTLNCKPDDLVWIKIHGTFEQLAGFNRGLIAKDIGRDTFKLDLIPVQKELKAVQKEVRGGELMDALIDEQDYSAERKTSLKELWRKLV